MLKNKMSTTAVAANIALTVAIIPFSYANQGYEVVEIDTFPYALSSTIKSLNNLGNMVGTAYDIADLPIDLDLINKNLFPGVQDWDQLTGIDYLQLYSYLNSFDTLPLTHVQKVTRFDGMWYQGGLTSLTQALDEVDPETGRLSRSNNLNLNQISDANAAVGQYNFPFMRQSGFDQQGQPLVYFSSESYPRAVWTDGTQVTFLTGEPGLSYGGLSNAKALNDHHQVVGYASVEDSEIVKKRIIACEDTESVIAHLPFGACMYELWAAYEYQDNSALRLYQEEAYLWELNAQGEVISQRRLGMATTPLDEYEPDEENPDTTLRVSRSEANDINNEGIAVGTTHYQEGSFALYYATLFQDGKAKLLFEEGDSGWARSVAHRINDQGYIVGHSLYAPVRIGRERLFIAHVDGREIIQPRGFYQDSSWVPRDLNNNNQVVGRAEKERSMEQTRRTVGFLYDIEQDIIVDLNAAVSCHSDYYIFDATSINDQGEIIALAQKKQEKEVDGKVFPLTSVISVLLKPQDGVLQCDDPALVQKRKKASLSWLDGVMLFMLTLGYRFFTRRRRIHEVN